MSLILATFVSLSSSCYGATKSESNAPFVRPGVPVRIMPIGDSITEGKFTDGGYRQILQDMLKAGGCTVTFVGKEDDGRPENVTGFSTGMANPNHEGYGSFRIDQIMNGGSIEGHTAPPITTTLADYKPDVILMMLGTNDMLQGYQLGSILGRLDQLVARVFAALPHVRLVLAAPTPIMDTRHDPSNIFGSGVPIIVEKYSALGYHIRCAYMTDQLVAEDFSDGIHPNVVGYQKMANVWFHALTNMVPKPIAEPSAAAGSQGVLSFVSAVRDGSNESFSLGYKFSTGPKPLVVTALGYLNDGAVGANAIHSVGIYNDSTQQLVTPAVSVTTTGGDLTGSHCTFTYVNLPVPVILSPNTTYEIAGTDPGTGFVRSAAGVTFSNGIVPGSAVADFTVATTLAFPASTSLPNGAANIGPNFRTAE